MSRTTIDIRCKICGTVESIQVYVADMTKWKEGHLIQDAFPYLTPSGRELLVSHICDTCFDKIFGGDE